MVRRFTGIVGALLLIAGTTYAGGWAVITVKDLPGYAVEGEPVTLTFAVRVHGMALTSGLNASITASSGPLLMKAVASPATERGHYRATFILPRAGDWMLTIDGGHGTNSTTRLPLTVIDPEGVAPVVREAERGQRLFAAKGCATCHVHEAVQSNRSVSIGPRLSGRRFQTQWLSAMLAHPPPARRQEGLTVGMPDLGLSRREIASLVAFLNGHGAATSAAAQ